jgi:hypothetical protein
MFIDEKRTWCDEIIKPADITVECPAAIRYALAKPR